MMEMFSGGNQGGGSNSGPFGNIMELMKLFRGAPEEVVPVWSSAAAFGTRRRDGIDETGTLELRIVPPTPKSPKTYLRLICGGIPIAMRPSELRELESAINRWHSADDLVGEMPDGEIVTGTLTEIYQQVQTLDAQAQSEAALQQFMG